MPGSRMRAAPAPVILCCQRWLLGEAAPLLIRYLSDLLLWVKRPHAMHGPALCGRIHSGHAVNLPQVSSAAEIGCSAALAWMPGQHGRTTRACQKWQSFAGVIWELPLSPLRLSLWCLLRRS